jgi:hypothetical protein
MLKIYRRSMRNTRSKINRHEKRTIRMYHTSNKKKTASDGMLNLLEHMITSNADSIRAERNKQRRKEQSGSEFAGRELKKVLDKLTDNVHKQKSDLQKTGVAKSKKSKTTPRLSHKIKYSVRTRIKQRHMSVSRNVKYFKRLNASAHKLLGVSFNKTEYDKRFVKIATSKYLKLRRSNLHYISFDFLKRKKSYKKWRAVGIKGSFFKDSRFLSFFIKNWK